jgi:hypothetical protein
LPGLANNRSHRELDDHRLALEVPVMILTDQN